MKINIFKAFDLANYGFSVMNRYIIRELIAPFLFGMGIFTSLGLSIGAVFELVRKVTEKGLFFGVAVQVLFLKMPGFIVLAFPMSILLATLMAYSRLSSDSELIALRSIGVNIYRLILPTIIFSLFIVSITFTLNNFVAPAANYQARITLKKALGESSPAFKTTNILLPEHQNIKRADGSSQEILTRLFYAEEFDGKQMKNLTVLDRSSGSISQIVTARAAQWNILDNTWDFYDGTIYLIGTDGGYSNVVRFQHQKLALPRTALDFAQSERKSDEMSILQAQQQLKIMEIGGEDKDVRKLRVRIQEKLALPFVCLVFALIGTAIGIKPQKSGKATSFGICIGLIFTYYLTSSICSSMGVWGVLSPITAAWLPNVLGLGTAIVLLTKATNY